MIGKWKNKRIPRWMVGNKYSFGVTVSDRLVASVLSLLLSSSKADEVEIHRHLHMVFNFLFCRFLNDWRPYRLLDWFIHPPSLLIGDEE